MLINALCAINRPLVRIWGLIGLDFTGKMEMKGRKGKNKEEIKESLEKNLASLHSGVSPNKGYDLGVSGKSQGLYMK